MTINLNVEKELISKEAILREFQDVEIYQKYLDFELKVGGKSINSPLREEENPSFGFFVGQSGEICFKDFKLGSGDFVKFVMLLLGLTYFEALSQIAADMGISDKYICKRLPCTKNNYIHKKRSREEIIQRGTQLDLSKRARRWLLSDRDYWAQFGIGLQTLKFFNVEPVDFIFINGVPYPTDHYSYCFIEYKDGNETYKIYQPYNTKYKWLNNHDNSVWQGWSQLPESGECLILTKSLKDVMSLYEVCGMPAVSLQSENLLPKRHVFQELTKRFKEVILLYDNDYDKSINWGMEFGEKLASEYGIMSCYINEQHKCKDFSDLVKKFGPKRANEILLTDTLIPF